MLNVGELNEIKQLKDWGMAWYENSQRYREETLELKDEILDLKLTIERYRLRLMEVKCGTCVNGPNHYNNCPYRHNGNYCASVQNKVLGEENGMLL